MSNCYAREAFLNETITIENEFAIAETINNISSLNY